MSCRDAAADRAEKNREESRGLDERIASRKLILAQLIGQDAVFHRAEQRREHAKQEKRHEQKGDGMQQHAGGRDGRRAHLGKLDLLSDAGLVETVGELPAEPRQEEERKDEQGARERHGGATFLLAELEEHEKRQRVLEEIVAERGEELAPEHRREAARSHERGDHGKHLLALRRSTRSLPLSRVLMSSIAILPCRELNNGI